MQCQAMDYLALIADHTEELRDLLNDIADDPMAESQQHLFITHIHAAQKDLLDAKFIIFEAYESGIIVMRQDDIPDDDDDDDELV